MSNFIRVVVRSNIKTINPIFGIHQNSNSLLRQNVAIYSMRYESGGRKGSGNHKPNLIDKYMLVWMKKFPSVSEVPSTVSYDMMERARNWGRIKINILMCIFTAVASVVIIYNSKKAAERGDSLRKRSIKWHEEQNAKKD